MKMNDTVARIVDLMFDNAEMTEEVAALRDEVMNNCQERFFDLVESGMAEDDAIAAVVESLKGMEDVIGQYGKRSRRNQPTAEYTVPDSDEQPDSGVRDMVFSPTEIHRIDLSLINEDVRLEPSDDGMYHVRWDADDDPQIGAGAENGTLRISRLPGDWNKKQTAHNLRIDLSNAKNARVSVNGKEVHFDEAGRMVEDVMDGVGGMMESLGRSLGRIFVGVKNAFSGGDGVTICIPHGAVPHVKLQTTSGDLDVTNVALADLSIVTTSGDADVNLRQQEHLERIEARSTSGDIDVNAHADVAVLSSTSGDVDVAGCIRELNANTISGNVDLHGDAEVIRFKTVSGDVELEILSDDVREIDGSTVSGDIDVDLPSGIGYIAMTTSTRSGDITTRYATNGMGPTVTGRLTSMSGDIIIR